MLSPELCPVGVDMLRHTISFVPVSRDHYQNAFLDPRSGQLWPNYYAFNLDDLLLYGLHTPSQTAPVYYVFHTAFCCSTLLARYLDLVQPCFVIREPSVLAQIALLRPLGTLGVNDAAGMTKADEWQSLMRLVVRLLTRTYAPGDIVVIKVNDLCNSVGDALLEIDARSRVIFLYVSLRIFLLSVLKRPSRRTWLRMRIRDTRRVAQQFPALASVDTARLCDAEAAAYLWLLNSALYQELSNGKYSKQVFALDGERVAERPKTAIEDVAAFLQLALSEQRLDELLNHPSVRRYSKDTSLEYDASSRRTDLTQADARFGVEAEEGVAWASGIKRRLEFDSPW
jgi:hypothetical protein